MHEVVTFNEALGRLKFLALWLEDQEQPLRLDSHPGMMLDPKQAGYLIRLLITTDGFA